MREQLARLGGLRRQFTGTFKRYGTKTGWQGRIEQTVLLVNIKKDGRGVTVADHLWFNNTKGFGALALEPGDVVRFTARVTTYEKGYKGFRDDENLPPVERDYRLSYPTKFKKVSGGLNLVTCTDKQLIDYTEELVKEDFDKGVASETAKQGSLDVPREDLDVK